MCVEWRVVTGSDYMEEMCFVPCARDCQLSSWTTWTVCRTEARCGNGVETRSRYIIEPSLDGGRDCPATATLSDGEVRQSIIFYLPACWFHFYAVLDCFKSGCSRPINFLSTAVSILCILNCPWSFAYGTLILSFIMMMMMMMMIIIIIIISLIFYSTFGYFLTEGLKNNKNNALSSKWSVYTIFCSFCTIMIRSDGVT